MSGERLYPVAPLEGDNDSRFTVGLMIDVGAVLEKHGYPPLREGLDYVDLQMALFKFIYREASPEIKAEVAERLRAAGAIPAESRASS